MRKVNAANNIHKVRFGLFQERVTERASLGVTRQDGDLRLTETILFDTASKQVTGNIIY